MTQDAPSFNFSISDCVNTVIFWLPCTCKLFDNSLENDTIFDYPRITGDDGALRSSSHSQAKAAYYKERSQHHTTDITDALILLMQISISLIVIYIHNSMVVLN